MAIFPFHPQELIFEISLLKTLELIYHIIFCDVEVSAPLPLLLTQDAPLGGLSILKAKVTSFLKSLLLKTLELICLL